MQQRNNEEAAPSNSNSNGQQITKQKKLFPLFAGPPKHKKPASDEHPDADPAAQQMLSLSSDPVGIKDPVAKSKGKAKTATSSKRSSSERNAAAGASSSPAKKGTSNGTRKGKKTQSLDTQVTAPIEPNNAYASASTSASASDVAPSASRPVTPPPPPQREVIEITDSPVRELAPIKTFDDFKAERDAKRAIKHAGGWLGGSLPLWPSKETIHVSASLPGGHRIAGQASVLRDLKGKGRAIEDTDLRETSEQDDIPQTERRTMIRRLNSSGSGSGANGGMQSAPSETDSNYDQFPIFARLSQQRETSQGQDLEYQIWSEKYAPTNAAEVLGQANNGHANFLKRWLQELTIRGECASSAAICTSGLF